MGAALYQNSHYGIPTIGWAHEMATLDSADALAFYDRWYTPNNAIVVVAGDVTEAEVRTLAEATYGKVARRAEPPPRMRLREPTARRRPVGDARRPACHRSRQLRRFYLAPSRSTGEPGEAEALDVLADILGGGATSRLYRQLVVDKGIAASAGAGYDSGRMGDTVFSLYGTPRGGTTLDQLAAAFDTVVADLVAKGVTDDELQRAIEHARADAIYSEDSPGSLARAFGGVLATGGTLADVQSMACADRRGYRRSGRCRGAQISRRRRVR